LLHLASTTAAHVTGLLKQAFPAEYYWPAAASALFIFEMLLIAGLLVNLARRSKVGKENERLPRLAEAEHRRLEEVVSNVPGIVWESKANPGGTNLKIHFVSEYVETMLGYSVEECLSIPNFWLSIVPEACRDKLASDIRQALASRKNGVIQFQCRAKDGRLLWAEAHLAPILDQKGGRVGLRGVTIDITARKMAEQAIIETETAHRSVFKAVHDAIFVHDAESGEIVDANRVLCDMHAVTLDEARTLGLEVLSSNEPPYSREAALSWIRKAAKGESQLFEWCIGDKTGRLFWVEVSMRRSVIGGKDRVVAVVRDVTYRKQVEEALRESEERFRTMADTAPVMIWIASTDKRCIYFNQQWLNFTGRLIEKELGNGWTEGVHSDDFTRCIETYETAFDLREPFRMEYRLRRGDGQFRWVLDAGNPRFSRGGKFLGYIGSCIDITERKEAEDVLANLSGQLIRAREDECARIARELHDDLNQRMALVLVELEQLGQNPPESVEKLRDQLGKVRGQITETSKEIHRMSYDLHPSKLAHLGLVASLESLCDELERKHGLRIEFRREDVPGNLSPDVSLCLYRIAQGCLNNVIRHSAAEKAKVELREAANEIRLRVTDSGVGFDVESPKAKTGLGLVSMRERLRLVGGTISIESRPSKGTEIDVRVPLRRIEIKSKSRSQDDKTQAAGG
jgi:PAS domain S-box-containing protein